MTEYLTLKTLLEIFPYILSAMSLGVVYMAGSQHKKTWWYGMVLQLFWLVWILLSKNYGFLLLNIGNWIVYIRNHYKWRKLPS